jgi:hypothetical protein
MFPSNCDMLASTVSWMAYIFVLVHLGRLFYRWPSLLGRLFYRRLFLRLSFLPFLPAVLVSSVSCYPSRCSYLILVTCVST